MKCGICGYVIARYRHVSLKRTCACDKNDLEFQEETDCDEVLKDLERDGVIKIEPIE